MSKLKIKKKRVALDWDLQLPDFAAPTVLLRVAILANLCMLVGAIVRQDASSWAPYESFMSMASVGEPALILSILLLGATWRRASERMRSFLAIFVGAFATVVVSAIQPGWSSLAVLKAVTNSMVVSLILCLYFDWRYRRLSPALSEAKLEALLSRMRPHFLFNAINGIVMLLGKSPSEAEEALLDLADVFRALLKEGASLSKLTDEVDLTKKYLRIEKMRFRDRLSVSFNLDEKCRDVLIPTMLLQPLAENAIIHGIESVGEGVIHVTAFVRDSKLTLIVENPYVTPSGSNIRKSNGIAMENIKQRLSLIYDLEAKLVCGPRDGGIWRVVVTMPALTSNHKKKN